MKTIYPPVAEVEEEAPTNVALMIQSVIGDTDPMYVLGGIGVAFIIICWLSFSHLLSASNDDGFEIE